MTIAMTYPGRPATKRAATRRGATTVESAIVLTVLLFLLFVTLDLGLAVARCNMLSGVTRTVARAAILRGSDASPTYSAWGATSMSFTGAASNEIATMAAPLLATMNPADVQFTVSWPDGDNDQGDRVRVQAIYSHKPIVPLLNVGSSITLAGQSTMQIVH